MCRPWNAHWRTGSPWNDRMQSPSAPPPRTTRTYPSSTAPSRETLKSEPRTLITEPQSRNLKP
eukprot:2265560-Rhodomonas_salina.1